MTSPLPELPEIPPEVYESRDRGDLVLFCGAGVSKSAGRPLFGELAHMVESKFGLFDSLAQTALNDGHFDQYLQLVEQALDKSASAGRLRRFVEGVIAEAPRTTAIHESILKLAQIPTGETRLVTTNYDRHFKEAAQKLGLAHLSKFEYAPRLAPPSKDRWSSVVHLHGGLDGVDLRDLVLTSGDFGRAYVTERWAARFVSELFEKFDVLFLGYSAEDIVIRYLLDAYAARPERQRGKLWAIAAPPGRRRAHWQDQWKARGVKLIPYTASKHFRGFGRALAEWAATIESPASRRTQLSRILDAGPVNLARAGRRNQLQWLLSDIRFDGVNSLFLERDGARRPHYVEWLDEFSELQLLEQRATRHATHAKDHQEARSLLVGPSVDTLVLGERAGRFAAWIADLALDEEVPPDGRSNSEVLLEWVQSGNRRAALHPQLADRIRFGLKQHGSKLPSELREAWTLVVDPGVNAALAPPGSWDESWDLEPDMEANPSVGMVAQRLLHAFTPFIRFVGSSAVRFRHGLRAFLARTASGELGSEAPRLSRYHYAESVVSLRCGFRDPGEPEHLMQQLEKSARRDALLREMALGVNAQLERCLTLLAHTNGAVEHFESLWYERVGSDRTGTGPGEWTLLADLASQAGAKLDEVGDRRARALYQAWLAGRHLTQRRLALHAAANWKNLSDDERTDAPGDWLTHRALASEVRDVLRRLKHKAELEPRLQARLAELEQSGAGDSTSAEADEGFGFMAPPAPLDISDANAERLAELMVNNTDFTSREGRTGGELEILLQRGESRRLLEAVSLAIEKYELRPSEVIAERQVFDEFPDRATRYLLAIAEHEENRHLSPDELLALWDKVEPVAMGVDRGAVSESSRDELRRALNHPAGKLAQALFAILLPKSVQYRSALDRRLKERVERNLIKLSAAGRAFLAITSSRLFVLHYAEPKWAAAVVVPSFDWKTDEARARTAWQGFLWAPSLNRELYGELRKAFLDAFERAEQLSTLAESLCGVLVSLALDGERILAQTDTRQAIRAMSAEMRSTVLWQLGKRLEAAGGTWDEDADRQAGEEKDENGGARAAELARTHVLPWLRDWPQQADVWSGDQFADRLTLLALRCGTALREATEFVLDQRWVKLGRYPLSLSHVLRWSDTRIVAYAPQIAALFDHVLPNKEDHLRLGATVWRPGQLQQLVEKLRGAGEPVTSSPEFKRLEARL